MSYQVVVWFVRSNLPAQMNELQQSLFEAANNILYITVAAEVYTMGYFLAATLHAHGLKSQQIFIPY